MNKFTYFFLTTFISSLCANTITVSSTADTNTAGTLRNAILTAQSGDTITFTTSITPLTPINLTSPLPAITQQNLTIAATTGFPVTINGNGTYQVFSAVQPGVNTGQLTLQNIVITNGLSIGGTGGAADGSGGGGGGGAGGGGGLYVHTGSNVTLQNVQLASNAAQGGNGGDVTGGLNGGGGGGGFGSTLTNQAGAGGAGSSSASGGGGGGGGGNPSGGNGGSGGAGQAGGSSTNGVVGGGGGGGSGNGAGGAAYAPMTTPAPTGGGHSGGGGGGGAGLGGNGAAGSASGGGIGGMGIGPDTYFGGGGGGGANVTSSSGVPGGAGFGTGGGGGSFQGPGGNGGDAGGGGGGGSSGGGATIDNCNGGNGGFGAGGGGGGRSRSGGGGGEGGSSLFGGGSGDNGTGTSSGRGGGGAAMGGNIFIQNQARLTIGDNVSISGGITSPGSGGGGGPNEGTAYGPDIFLRSGGTLIFTNSGIMTITTNIESDVEEGGGTGGGLIMQGTGTLVLGDSNTYTSSTQILSGTLQISQDTNLGYSTNTVTIQNGILQTTANINSARAFSLTGSSATISTDPLTTLTLTGLIDGSGSLTKQGTGTLILDPTSLPNTYTGNTTIAAGTLQIQGDSALGNATSSVTMASGSTLAVVIPPSSSISSARPFTLQSGPATINVTANPATGPAILFLTGNMHGSGQLVKTGDQILGLFGVNSYSGGTVVNEGTLIGNTISLPGGNATINSPGILTFLQAATGTYTGIISGNGTLEIGDGASTFPQVTMSADSSSFTGPTTVYLGGNVNVTGSLAASAVTVQAGGFLSGTGTIGTLANSGNLQPGNPLGTLTVNGNLTLSGSPNFFVDVSPTSSSLLQVLGTAALTGTLTITPTITGFYGLGNTYTILTSTGLTTGTFSPVLSDPNFITSVSYSSNAVVLTLKVEQPFLNFPYANPNEKSVGENIDALSEAGYLTSASPLGEAINSLRGFSDAAINQALDQMHPAPFSAFAEIQAALGGQLLSMFHRRPVPGCACYKQSRLWVEPYGNWLKEKNIGYELGFNAISKGVAGGIDTETEDGIVFGLGAGWNDTHMQWRRGQGHSTITGYYGAVYIDYATDNFYLGLSGIGGYDTCNSSRHLQFSTINEHANASRHNVEMMGQLASAIFFGPSACFAFPYFNLDYFYLREGKAQESGAPGLNLSVSRHSSSTLRSEVGFAVQVQDINRANTMCVSPLFGLGWAMEMPLHRPKYKATFEDQPIPFYVQGWDYTWQLFTLRFGFTITYRCLSLAGSYIAEMSPLKQTPFFDQRGDLRLEWSW
ncbi:MAG: autotransporter domain-containing protein [Chlamydiales bacterium]|nr:autotransporter domain-containing protein [Chlamydiales bacterium]